MRPDPAISLLLVATALVAGPAPAEEWSLGSPDGQVVLAVRQAEGQGGRLEYSLTCAGSPVLEASPLGIVRRDAAFGEHLTLETAGESKACDEGFTLLHGKRRQVRDQYRERTLVFRNATGAKVELELRAYDDGAAFRYRFPGDGPEKRTVIEERTGFRLPEGSRVWAMPFDDPNEYRPAYEAF